MSDGGVGLAERLREVADAYGSRKEAAEAGGVSLATLGRYLAGDAVPGFDAVARMAQPKGYSLDWLWAGEGDMRSGGHSPLEPARPPHAQVDGELLQNTIEALEELLADEGLELAPDKKARAIALTYQLFREDGKVDRETLGRIVHLAA